jgi:6,7-dimethyl-8-ribityllumazine synthase
MKQALERADPKKKNMGGKAVSAVLQSLMYFK